MEERLKSIMSFYLLATRLKYKIRSGWDETHWNVSKERLESVAEHIYGTCILALSIDSEFETNLDIDKIIKMLVLHELGEVIIGDITPFDNITPEEKTKREHAAMKDVLGDLVKNDLHYCWNLMQKRHEKQFLRICAINWRLIFRRRFIRIWDVKILWMSRKKMWFLKMNLFSKCCKMELKQHLIFGTNGIRLYLQMMKNFRHFLIISKKLILKQIFNVTRKQNC